MAVFTHLSKADIENFLGDYPVGHLLSFEGIAQGIDNTNYKIETSAGKYVLTIFEKRINPDDLPFFLGFMNHLSHNGIICPAPLSALSSPLRGEDLGEGDKFLLIKNKPSALFNFLNGRDVKPDDITPVICHELGILLGKMHVAGQNFNQTRTNSMGWNTWNERITRVGDKSFPILGDKSALPASELSYLKSHWPENLPTGAVHADLFPDNVFINDGHIYGVIDFYFSATDYLAYDLAIVMNAWCFNADNHFDADRWAGLITGYESIRPLTQPEKESYQILSRGAAMRFLSSRLFDLVNHDPNALVHPKPPAEYLEKLEFHQSYSLLGDS